MQAIMDQCNGILTERQVAAIERATLEFAAFYGILDGAFEDSIIEHIEQWVAGSVYQRRLLEWQLRAMVEAA